MLYASEQILALILVKLHRLLKLSERSNQILSIDSANMQPRV